MCSGGGDCKTCASRPTSIHEQTPASDALDEIGRQEETLDPWEGDFYATAIPTEVHKKVQEMLDVWLIICFNLHSL